MGAEDPVGVSHLLWKVLILEAASPRCSLARPVQHLLSLSQEHFLLLYSIKAAEISARVVTAWGLPL